MAPGVDGNAELRDLAADLFEHVLDRVALDLGELVDVVTLVPALGRFLPPTPSLDGGAKEIDLPTGVVEVVLAFHLVPGVIEDPRDGVAVRPVSGRPDRQRACRIGRNELDLDLLRRLRVAGSVIGPDFGKRAGQPLRRHPEVEESRTRDLGPLDFVELGRANCEVGGQVAWRALVLRRGPERDVRRVVAVRGIARPFERNRCSGELREAFREAGNGVPGRVGGAGHGRSIVAAWTTTPRSDSSTSTSTPSRWPASTRTSRM